MARRIVPIEFVPDGYCADGLLLPERRGIFGVRFTLEGKRQIKKAIDVEEGEHTEDDVDDDTEDDEDRSRGLMLSRIMRWYTIHTMAERTLQKHYGDVDSIPDDIYVHLANELGIDWRRFEHNKPKLPIDDFLNVASKTLSTFEMPANETRWRIQQKKLRAAWDGWVEQNCSERNCPEHSHYQCEQAYGEPNYWAIAKTVYDHRRETQKLISAIDVKPRGKAVKVANDALARIAVATRRAG